MELTVAVPSSLVMETDDTRLRTYKVGQVARSLAVFRCDRVLVFDDEPDYGDLIVTVLEYAATAPYLRKDAFDKRDELRDVGVVPPLGIPPHRATGGSDPDGSEPQYRQGIVTKVGSDGRVWVNCGKQHPVALRVSQEIREGERVTLRISSREPFRAELADVDDERTPYTGYEVERAPLDDWLDSFEGVAVCTSRRGEEVGREVTDLRTEGKDLALVFGSPERGVQKILGSTAPFDAVVNTLPRQGTATVRTEEAVLATLSLTNVANR